MLSRLKMKKEGKSRLMKFLEYITSKAFRDVVRNLFYTFVFIGIVLLLYFVAVNYSAKKVKENTGVDILKDLIPEEPEAKKFPETDQGSISGTSQGVLPDIGLSDISAEPYVENGQLKTKITFTTSSDTDAYVKLSGNNKILNKTSENKKNHEIIFDMAAEDFGALFVYTVIAKADAGNEEKVMGKARMPVKDAKESAAPDEENTSADNKAKITIG